ncbi:MAG TPA: DUF3341 domain-containing protein [Opitutus sp.]|nr:DUF3341 domain-containing protein [Opitutus sp.]
MSRARPGLVARYETPHAFLAALRRVHDEGYTRLQAFTPYPVEGMDELLRLPPTPIAWIMGGAAILGSSGAYSLQYWATHDYPINVGGRPLNSWPSFIPITFELTVLTVSITGVVALLWLCGLPRLHHAVFHVPGFERASQDRFFLRVRADDPRFDAQQTRALLAATEPETIEEVPA